jgi:hypothetical protein
MTRDVSEIYLVGSKSRGTVTFRCEKTSDMGEVLIRIRRVRAVCDILSKWKKVEVSRHGRPG